MTDPDSKPSHGILRLTVRQLSSKRRTAFAMYLQGFGVNVIAETLALPLPVVREYIDKEQAENDRRQTQH